MGLYLTAALAAGALIDIAHSQNGIVDQQLKAKYLAACPPYEHYSKIPHPPFSDGPLNLPYQRPAEKCRTFTSDWVETVVADMNDRMIDKDLARIFENAFPNTLDTTVRWHVTEEENPRKDLNKNASWEGAQSFIVTGDINAEWLRDSTNQLQQYQPLAKKDDSIFELILGAINTQAEYVNESPYCNAFQPPLPSKLRPIGNFQSDQVHPAFEPSQVFECKYELDSLAAFLSLTNQFYNYTGSTTWLTPRWLSAIENVIKTLDEQTESTFDPETGAFQQQMYRFQRTTNTGTETLNLMGNGNPLNWGTGLVRSAFRPSDDATVFGYLIPANAMMAVELQRTASILAKEGQPRIAELLQARGDRIQKGVWEHGIVAHKEFGHVFAFEVDGYGSAILMDDANLPSLLALPLLGFVGVQETTYQNTRKLILSKKGNPYYLSGDAFSGIGGPHIGLQNAWPMSVLVQIMTSDDDKEIEDLLEMIKLACPLGLVHESINVDKVIEYSRSWFAWANSVYAQTILNLADRKPHILFGTGSSRYRLDI